ncbi:hypothetical protein QQG55_24410 [Brugia pahangi]
MFNNLQSDKFNLNANQNCIVRCILKNDRGDDYFLLLSNAVISVMISKQATAMEMISKQMNSSLFETKIGKITRNLYKSTFKSSYTMNWLLDFKHIALHTSQKVHLLIVYQ